MTYFFKIFDKNLRNLAIRCQRKFDTCMNRTYFSIGNTYENIIDKKADNRNINSETQIQKYRFDNKKMGVTQELGIHIEIIFDHDTYFFIFSFIFTINVGE